MSFSNFTLTRRRMAAGAALALAAPAIVGRAVSCYLCVFRFLVGNARDAD